MEGSSLAYFNIYPKIYYEKTEEGHRRVTRTGHKWGALPLFEHIEYVLRVTAFLYFVHRQVF
jgi:hypothetical protein